MKTCPECGTEVSDNAFYCPNCGYPMNNDEDENSLKDKDKVEGEGKRNRKFCPNCGAEVPIQAAFCPQCGAAISNSKDNNSQLISSPNGQQQVFKQERRGSSGMGCWGQGCLITLLFLVVVCLLFVATCPDKQEHKAQLCMYYQSYLNNEAANGDLSDQIVSLGTNLAPGLIMKFVDARLEFINWWVFSLGVVVTDDNDILPAAISYGYLGHVTVLIGKKK